MPAGGLGMPPSCGSRAKAAYHHVFARRGAEAYSAIPTGQSTSRPTRRQFRQSLHRTGKRRDRRCSAQCASKRGHLAKKHRSRNASDASEGIEGWRKVYDLNLFAPIMLCRGFASALGRRAKAEGLPSSTSHPSPVMPSTLLRARPIQPRNPPCRPDPRVGCRVRRAWRR